MGTYADYGQQADDRITVLDVALAAANTTIADLTKQRDEWKAKYEAAVTPPPPPVTNGIPVKGRTLFGAASSDLGALESKVGTLGVYRSYWQANQQAAAISRANADTAVGRIPWLSFKLPSGWAAMASGSGDAWATSLANELGAVKGPVWVALHHEPENDGVMADWVKLQQRLAPIFKAKPNIAYTMILMGWHQWMTTSVNSMDALWPGKQHIDLVAFDPYNWFDTSNSAGKKSYAWDELKTAYYDKITAWLAKTGNESVAWGIAETGYANTAAAVPQNHVAPNGKTVSTRGSGADWLTRAYDDMKAAGGAVLTYFDVSAAVNNEPTDWTWPITTEPKISVVRNIVAKADRP
jgi:hypothetical protein